MILILTEFILISQIISFKKLDCIIQNAFKEVIINDDLRRKL